MSTTSTAAASLYDTLLTVLPNLLSTCSADLRDPATAVAWLGQHLLGDHSAAARQSPVNAELPAALKPGIGEASGPRRNTQQRDPPDAAAGADRLPDSLPDSQGGPPAALTVSLLDGFQVSAGGELLNDFPDGNVRDLFTLLLLHRRRPLSRARLCGKLWPRADPDSARNSLNVTVHRLRRVLGDPALVEYGDGAYRLRLVPGFWLDTEWFLTHAALGTLEDSSIRPERAIAQYEAAIALYGSDLLEEGEHESPLAADSQALQDRLNHVLERLATLREERGDWHGCLRAVHRHLAVDQCNEVAHRRAMSCYARLGQPQLAERQYRNCQAALRSCLGVHPHPQTTALYHEIGSRKAA